MPFIEQESKSEYKEIDGKKVHVITPEYKKILEYMGLFWFNFNVDKGKIKGTNIGKSQYFLFINTWGNNEP